MKEHEMSLRERLAIADDGRQDHGGPSGLAAAAYQELKLCGRIHHKVYL
jgi:hypothetical protein